MIWRFNLANTRRSLIRWLICASVSFHPPHVGPRSIESRDHARGDAPIHKLRGRFVRWELIKPKSMQLIIVFVKGQMCLCDQAGNFCHRSVELIDPIIIVCEYK